VNSDHIIVALCYSPDMAQTAADHIADVGKRESGAPQPSQWQRRDLGACNHDTPSENQT